MKVIPLLAALLIGTAHAEDWTRYNIGAGTYIEADMDSIKAISQDVRNVVVRMRLGKPAMSAFTGQLYDTAVALWEFDCKERKRRVVEITSFHEGKRLAGERTSDDWRDAPGTSGVFIAVCGRVFPLPPG